MVYHVMEFYTALKTNRTTNIHVNMEESHKNIVFKAKKKKKEKSTTEDSSIVNPYMYKISLVKLNIMLFSDMCSCVCG